VAELHLAPGFVIFAAGGSKLPSAPLGVILVGAIVFAVSVPIARKVARMEGDPWLARLFLIGLGLHFLAAPAQIFVDNHFYHGVADFSGYVHQGATLSHNFRSFNFTTKGADLRSALGDGSVSIAAGIVFAIVGVNELATFFVFSLFTWLGQIFFYRAFCLTFPEAEHRRYALMLFLLPSLLFWTSDVSKEAVMMLALGVTSLGAARILARRRGGYPVVALGIFMGIFTRPNEYALVLGGFAIAIFFRAQAASRELRAVRRVGSIIFLLIILAVTAVFTVKFVHSNAGTFSTVLGGHSKGNTNANTSATTAAGFGSSNVPYSKNPILYPRDIYTVLFDPLPITARSITQLLASGENTVILVLVLTSLRRLRLSYRAGRERPYVIVCLIYTLGFLYAFAALGNLGLITRERTLLFPYLLVLLAIPISPKGEEPRYSWERRRPSRRERRLAAARAGEFVGAPLRAPPTPSSQLPSHPT
jgi:hypothetical protein